MDATRSFHIRNRIKAFKHDTDCFGRCARIAAARQLPYPHRIITVNHNAATKIAEWGFAYDAMLRGEYGEV